MGAQVIPFYAEQSAVCSEKAKFGRRKSCRKAREHRLRRYVCPICHRWHLSSMDRDGWR